MTVPSWPARMVSRAIGMGEKIPHSLIALLARFSIAAVFWTSGQTKVEGLAINVVTGEFSLGWPRLSDSALALFRTLVNSPNFRYCYLPSANAFSRKIDAPTATPQTS